MRAREDVYKRQVCFIPIPITSFSDGKLGNNRSNTEDDAKCGKERAHFVGSNGADGYFEKILIIQFTCCNVKC